MVKDSKTSKPQKKRVWGPRPGRVRGPPGPDARDHRMMMRMHSGLVSLLDVRSRDRGESRSRFIEKILIAYLAADPRNPRLDAVGRLLDDGPAVSRAGEPVKFGAAWSRWVALNEILFDWKPGDAQRDEDPADLFERLTGAPYQEGLEDQED
ncbi:hypothetical protein BF49_5597 [Bradyrhizobium sp.]|uniref:hypothetical protein n=1 Tax=Bradyrhizobium sp. TaxID=376 RepID=UPI0007C1B105|nr:hypothetical protein [Bradyrhizobium sp.]CUT14517.1 hypothetical protein BF49_5597 [Bradyrhizobium sp.]